MQYGFFDDKAREYVITRPDTPAPWANYLGSPAYGAIISNNAGGYSFVRSGANGRILRYVFNAQDRPGRYIYLHDDDSGKYWSVSWQPVGGDLSQNSYECRHGLGYTKLSADVDGICAEAVYYVPLSKEHEVWAVTVTNRSGRLRQLTATGYAEFTNNSNYEQDSVNLQYSQFITQTEFHGSRISQYVHANLHGTGRGRSADNGLEERFFGLAGEKVSSWCGDRDAFLGAYHDYGDPVGVTSGALSNTGNYCGNSCGALACVLSLQPGESRTFAFLLGAKTGQEADALTEHYRSAGTVCGTEISSLKAYWEDKLSALQVKTPSSAFDSMINTWHAYNCFITFIWSRAASFTYCGLRNGYGYRDTVQDIQGIIHLDPQMAADRIRFMLSAQADNGGGLPLVKFTHDPGHEDTPDDASYVKETGHPAWRADDALWLFPTVYKYMAETGDTAFLDEVIPFANRDEGTVYEHLRRALRFSEERLGPHGMPAGLYADWNDCLRLGEEGESVFVAFQYYYAMLLCRAFAKVKGDAAYERHLSEQMGKLREVLQKDCWNEDRFIRGFTQDGAVIGKRDDAEANMWLNPQSWSVISRFADKAMGETAMENVFKRLNTSCGAVIMDPPYKNDAFDGALMVIFNAGCKENAGIFSQPQGWLILAEALLGHGDRAFRYWEENSPSVQNENAEIRRMEPYVYGQFTEGPASLHFGRSHVHWLTGTASTMMVGCVEGILGMRPDPEGLRIQPAIPAGWEELKIRKNFRGHILHITIRNPRGVQSGCSRISLNGKTLENPYLPAADLKEENEVELVM